MVAILSKAGRASDCRRVRRGQWKPLGAVSAVVRRLQRYGPNSRVYGSGASWVETIAVVGADLQRADASDPGNGPTVTSTGSVGVNDRIKLASPSQRLRAFQTSSAGQRRAHSGATNG